MPPWLPLLILPIADLLHLLTQLVVHGALSSPSFTSSCAVSLASSRCCCRCRRYRSAVLLLALLQRPLRLLRCFHVQPMLLNAQPMLLGQLLTSVWLALIQHEHADEAARQGLVHDGLDRHDAIILMDTRRCVACPTHSTAVCGSWPRTSSTRTA